jgi:PIH1 CS-like domain
MKCKGNVQATMIREKDPHLKLQKETSTEFLKDMMNVNATTQPHPKSDQSTSAPSDASTRHPLIEEIDTKAPEPDRIVAPKYTIVHQGNVDFKEFTHSRVKTEGSRPQALVVRIEIPKVVRFSVSDDNLTIFSP